MTLQNRINAYHTISAQLASMSDQELADFTKNTYREHAGICGATAGILNIDETRLFFKTINLTDLEMRPANQHSTRNMFELPLYYQYGIRLGTTGFGAWRELASQIMSTNWVLSGACENFPLLYHWRIVPRTIPISNADLSKALDEHAALWDGSPTIRARFEAVQKAPASIILFMEQIPYQIDPWLASKFNDGTAQPAVTMIEQNLHAITSFMKSQGFLHFDAHFGNILTDGNQLYFADFGLAMYSGFELSEPESAFFKSHSNYDHYETMAMITLRIIDNLFQEKDRKTVLDTYAIGTGQQKIAPWADTILIRYAPITVTLLEFWQQLRTNITTPYPEKALELANQKGLEADKMNNLAKYSVDTL